jgi:hypothetical protein
MFRHFIFLILMCCAAVLAPVGSDAADGSGNVSTINNRYVLDAGGTPKFLIGYYDWGFIDSHEIPERWNDLMSMMNLGEDYRINYIRVSLGINRLDGKSRVPFAYTGNPAKADLDSWDSTYWTDLKTLASYARSKGILFHVSIFDSVDIKEGPEDYRWINSFWNVANQTKSFYGDIDLDSSGGAHKNEEFYNLSAFNAGTGIGYNQKALIDKATTELSAYENVFFEVGNELSEALTTWDDAVLTYIRTKTKKLVTVNTCERYRCVTPTAPGMFVSHVAQTVAEVKSGVAAKVGNGWPAMEDADGSALKAATPDKLRQAAWYSFAGGAAGFGGFTDDMEGGIAGARTTVLTQYQYLQDFISASGISFWTMTPKQSLVSNSTYNSLLANSGVEYMAYVLSDSSVTITLASGYYNVRYYNPATGVFTEGGGTDGGSWSCKRPSGASDWVVYLKSTTSGPPRFPSIPRSLSITS